MEMVNEIKKLVDAKKEAFLHAGDLVWEYAEIGFKEFQSAKALTDVLKAEGFAVLDAAVEEPMKAAIRAAGAEGDSVGGVLETAILGLPAGIGEPYFDSVESEIAHLAFSIPAVKGIEFGSGFGFADQKGSEANDAFRMQGGVMDVGRNTNGALCNTLPQQFRVHVFLFRNSLHLRCQNVLLGGFHLGVVSFHRFNLLYCGEMIQSWQMGPFPCPSTRPAPIHCAT